MKKCSAIAEHFFLRLVNWQRVVLFGYFMVFVVFFVCVVSNLTIHHFTHLLRTKSNRKDETHWRWLFSHKFVVCTTWARWNFVIFINCHVLWTIGADICATAGFFTCFYDVIHNNLLYICPQGFPLWCNLIVWVFLWIMLWFFCQKLTKKKKCMYFPTN